MRVFNIKYESYGSVCNSSTTLSIGVLVEPWHSKKFLMSSGNLTALLKLLIFNNGSSCSSSINITCANSAAHRAIKNLWYNSLSMGMVCMKFCPLSFNSGKIVWAIACQNRAMSASGKLVLYYSNGKCGWSTDSCSLLGGCLLLGMSFYGGLLYVSTD